MVSKKLSIVLIVALVLRLIMGLPLLNSPERMLQNDSPSYLKVADNLAKGNGYSNCPEAPFYKDVLRTPTYPVMLAGLKFITSDNRIVFFFQIILDLLTVILLYKIGKHLFDELSGLVASGFYSFSIINTVMCAQVLAETSFVFLMIISLYILVVKERFLLCGLTLGLAVLCKPIGLYTFTFFVLYFIVSRKGFKSIGLFVLPFIILIGGWMIRNHNITNSVTISSISSYSLFAYNANLVLSHQTGTPESVLREERISNIYKNTEGELGDYSGKYDYMTKFAAEGKEVILNNLGLYTVLHLKNSINSLIPGVHYVLQLFGKTEGGRGTMDVLRRDGIFSAAKYYFHGSWGGLIAMAPWILVWMLMIMTALLGLVKSLGNKKWEIILLVVGTGFYFLFISGPAAEPRFGALVAPYFCLLGGYYLGGLERFKNLVVPAQ